MANSGIAASGPLSELLRTRSLTQNRSLQSAGRAGTSSSGRSTGASALMRTTMSSSLSPFPGLPIVK